MLLERDRQLATLSDQLRLGRTGAGSLVLISGEAGAGKTTLVTVFVSPSGVKRSSERAIRCRRHDR